jgi:hypothetical protein
VHTGNGGLVVEVSDTGIGMTEADLRVANTRLESGGEVNPYTARHMGLFVVSRLAAQHGLIVRLRSTVANEPDSGTTAGVYVPAELIARSDAPDTFLTDRFARVPADHHEPDVETPPAPAGTGPIDVPVALLPQRSPGASGIAEMPSSIGAPVPQPTDTSAFFAARPPQPAPPPQPEPQPAPRSQPEPQPQPEPRAKPETVSATAGSDDAIYQSMLSEWLIDPTEIANSTDLNWETVWDHGWSAAAAAAEAPVERHTDDGLPVREPGARLVPGAADDNPSGPVASAAESGPGPQSLPRRDPDAVRASLGSHFTGVHAGRSHARDPEGPDHP